MQALIPIDKLYNPYKNEYNREHTINKTFFVNLIKIHP